MAHWTADDIPPQTGRVALVTGANTGIGYETARQLARRGARVLLAVRDISRGEAARQRIRAEHPTADVSLIHLDLADLRSVRACAAEVLAESERLDLLVNNAGVMMPPRAITAQGFELQFGTNHLGHFALTGLLLPRLLDTPTSRVVVVTSSAHHSGRIDLEDLQWERRTYKQWGAYAQSKLATTLFGLELDRRLRNLGSSSMATLAHPGWTATELQRTSSLVQLLNPLFAMRPADGALPTLRAATDPAAQGGTLWGPAKYLEMHGPPMPARLPRAARDVAVAQRLWALSEQLTGVTFPS